MQTALEKFRPQLQVMNCCSLIRTVNTMIVLCLFSNGSLLGLDPQYAEEAHRKQGQVWPNHT